MRRRARGDLEAEVLQRLWRASEPVTSGWLRESFLEADRPKLTTLLTVLDRLETKGLVSRSRPPQGAARFAAVPTASREAAAEMTRVLGRSKDRDTALLHFAGQLDEHDLDTLRRLIDGGRG